MLSARLEILKVFTTRVVLILTGDLTFVASCYSNFMMQQKFVVSSGKSMIDHYASVSVGAPYLQPCA